MNLQDADREHLWHPYTRHSAAAAGLPVMVRGEGPYLFDETGRRWVDGIASWWAASLGHSHPAIVAAIREQAGQLQHGILGNATHPQAIRLAEKLAHLMPTPERHVHFASDGASAVEAALKVALQYAHNLGHPERTQLLSLREAYHGDTLATLSLGFLDAFHEPFRAVRRPGQQVPVPPYDATLPEALAAAHALFEQHGSTLAAVVVEPLCQGAAGMRIYPAEFLRELFLLAQKYEVPFIADEIATGFGRTGSLFAFEQAGIDPEMVCVGKALSAGSLPISAVVVQDRLFNTFTDQPVDHTFYHGHTFAGNPIAAAAALAALDVYEKENLVARVREWAPLLAEKLGTLRGAPGVRDVRCLGLIGAVELDTAERARQVQAALHDKGLLVRPLGPVVYLMPPLIIESDILEEMTAHFVAAIAPPPQPCL